MRVLIYRQSHWLRCLLFLGVTVLFIHFYTVSVVRYEGNGSSMILNSIVTSSNMSETIEDRGDFDLQHSHQAKHPTAIAIASVMTALCRQCKEITTNNTLLEALGANIEETCEHYKQVVGPHLQELLASGEQNKFEYYKRRLARSLYYQQFYLNRLATSKVQRRSAVSLQSLFRETRAALMTISVSKEFEKQRRLQVRAVGEALQADLLRIQGKFDDIDSCKAKQTVTCHYIGTGGYAFGLQRLKWCFAAGNVLNRRVIFNENNHLVNPSFYENRNYCNDTVFLYYQKASEQHLYEDYYVILPNHNPTLEPFLPRFVSRKWVDQLDFLVDDVSAWYLGHLTSFILTPSKDIWQRMLDSAAKFGLNLKDVETGNSEPIAGVHIRRGRKLTEAAYQPTEKYLELVEDYFLYLEELHGRPFDRRVYMATLDPHAEKEWRRLAPNHKIYKIDWQLPEVVRGMKVIALESIMTDIILLAHCDFFVGTFSSSVGGVTYHLRQALRPNAHDTTISLDGIWFLNPWHAGVVYRATRNHTGMETPREITLKTGNVLKNTEKATRTFNLRNLTGKHYEAIRCGHQPGPVGKSTGPYPLYKVDLDIEDAVFEERDLQRVIEEAIEEGKSLKSQG